MNNQGTAIKSLLKTPWCCIEGGLDPHKLSADITEQRVSPRCVAMVIDFRCSFILQIASKYSLYDKSLPTSLFKRRSKTALTNEEGNAVIHKIQVRSTQESAQDQIIIHTVIANFYHFVTCCTIRMIFFQLISIWHGWSGRYIHPIIQVVLKVFGFNRRWKVL